MSMAQELVDTFKQALEASILNRGLRLMNGKDKTPATRERLLEAAGEVFAERGFRAATIRGICERAKANVAAVNYHFGEKEELYKAVFDYARDYAPRFPQPVLSAGPAEQQLHAFIHTTLTRYFDEGRPAWLGKLIAREMIDPTIMLGRLMKNQIRPNAERLKSIVRQLIGREVDEETLWRCVFSVVAQWVFYFHCRQVVARLNPDRQFGPTEIQRLADHITTFSITALKGWKDAPVGFQTPLARYQVGQLEVNR
jgi:AcrR family transcriptional regulator